MNNRQKNNTKTKYPDNKLNEVIKPTVIRNLFRKGKQREELEKAHDYDMLFQSGDDDDLLFHTEEELVKYEAELAKGNDKNDDSYIYKIILKRINDDETKKFDKVFENIKEKNYFPMKTFLFSKPIIFEINEDGFKITFIHTKKKIIFSKNSTNASLKSEVRLEKIFSPKSILPPKKWYSFSPEGGEYPCPICETPLIGGVYAPEKILKHMQRSDYKYSFFCKTCRWFFGIDELDLYYTEFLYSKVCRLLKCCL